MNTTNEIQARRKTIDVSSMSMEQIEALQTQIGQKIANDFNELCDKTRKMLNVYGMDIKISYHIFEAGQDPIETSAQKPKKSRKVKTTYSK